MIGWVCLFATSFEEEVGRAREGMNREEEDFVIIEASDNEVSLDENLLTQKF